jgi:hypothetical protein
MAIENILQGSSAKIKTNKKKFIPTKSTGTSL